MTARTFAQISVASCSTQPGRGRSWACSTCSTATIVASWSNRMHRVDVVPWSIAATTDVAAMLRACQKRVRSLR